MDAGGQPVTGDDAFTDPRWDYPEYPAGSVVEVRVHGVGGEPPSGMARDPQPRLVSGDELAGFWRSRNPVIGRLPGGRSVVREVLAWGGQTSGTTRHAFWVLLLPFALFNMAGRMHRSDPDSRWSVAHRAVCRVLAHTMTLSFVALVAGVAIDLVAVQCALAGDCLEASADLTGGVLLAPFRRYADDHLARMALAALVPVLAVLVLWWAGRYRTRQLEWTTTEAGRPSGGEASGIGDPRFWQNAWPTSRLRALHATGAFAYVSGILSLVLLDLGPVGQRRGWLMALWVSVAVAVATAALVAWPRVLRTGPDPLLHRLHLVLRAGAVVPGTVALSVALVPGGLSGGAGALLWLVAVALAVWWLADELQGPRTGAPDVGVLGNLRLVAATVAATATLRGANAALDRAPEPVLDALPRGLQGLLDGSVGQLFLDLNPGLYVPVHLALWPVAMLQGLLVLVLVVTAFERRPARRADASLIVRPAVPGNQGAAVVALLSLLLLTATGGSIHALALDWLGQRGDDLTLPWWHAAMALVTAVGLPVLLLVLAAGTLLAGRWLVARPTVDQVAAHLRRGVDGDAVPAPDPEDDAARDRLARIGRAWLLQAWVRAAGRLLAAAVGLMTLVLVVVLVRQATVPAGLAAVNDYPLTTMALWLVVVGAVAVVGLIRSGLSARATRRSIGRVWDVLTMWPRITHPFAPPCYGEAIVPMLADRTRRLVDRGHPVVLAGHSQGSVVSLAATGHLADPTAGRVLDRVALVTYGSPLAILYERFYPGVFGGSRGPVARVADEVGSWHHLYALTDPLADPFWDRDGFDEVDAREARAGWGLSLAVPHADVPCPVCGWYRHGRHDGGSARRTDHAVSDPDRWTQPLDAHPPVPGGHSSYHDHREVDLHLAAIATDLADTVTGT